MPWSMLTRHFGVQVGEFVLLAELFDLRARVGASARLENPAPGGPGSGMKTQMKSSCSSQG